MLAGSYAPFESKNVLTASGYNFFCKRTPICSFIYSIRPTFALFYLIPFYFMTRLSPYLESDAKEPSIFKTYFSFICQIVEYHTGKAIKDLIKS